MTARRWLVALAFFVLPALLYAGLVTRFSFDLFAPSYGWQAYNYFALSLADGRQSIPAEAIGGEGVYIGGKVYMYYGMLPALLRLPLVPFVDLRVLPVSNLMVWLMLVIGQSALQLSILRIFAARGHTDTTAERGLLVLVSFAAWFASGSFLIVQNASFYHEPYAAALMLVGLFTALLADDLLVRRQRPAGARMIAYAAIAGLAVFTRQTCAVGLYLATLALLMPEWQALRARPGATLVAAAGRSLLPLAVLLLAGVAYLVSNHVRGVSGTGWSVENYGYYILGNNRPRLATLIEQQFSAVRILPNALYVLIGEASLRERLIEAWGGGVVVTFNRPVRWALFGAVPLLLAAIGILCLWRRLRRGTPLALPFAGAAAGLLLATLVLLAYATMQYRYTAEVWPPLCWLVLIAMRDVHLVGRGRVLLPVLGLLAAGSAAYSIDLRRSMLKDSPTNWGSLRIGAPLPAELAALATAPGARAPEIIPNRAAAGPDPDLPPGWRVRRGYPVG